MDHIALSRQCDDHARRDAERSRTVVDSGAFRALLDPGTDLIWLNYAVPITALAAPDDIQQCLTELERVFTAHERTLRFEFNTLPWPTLPAALERYGLQLQAEQPLMVCTPATFTPVAAPEVVARLLDEQASDAELRATQTILQLSFGGEVRETSDEEVAALRNAVRDEPNLQAIALHDTLPAGIASLSPIDAVAELTGVATHPELRRRGVAATLSSFLVQTHFGRGGTMAWLSAGDGVAEATYQKLGFHRIDMRLNYLLPTS